MSSVRDRKDAVYAEVGRVGRALGSPRRLELVELLAQAPHTVEDAAHATGMSVANCSQHLRVLFGARLVERDKRGTFVRYSLAPGVAEVTRAIRALAEVRLAGLAEARAALFADLDTAEPVDRDTLRRRLADGDVLLIDVRSREEFAHGHIAGARSVPLGELAELLDDLPPHREVVAYCRGPACVFAADAVRALRDRGFVAHRLEDSVVDWAATGGDVATGPG